MVRAVIDTNIILSGALKPGIPRKIWAAFKYREFKLIASPSMLVELSEVLSRPRFRNLIDEETRKDLLLQLSLYSESVEPLHLVKACRDPEDNHILSCAQEGNADFIVTGDKDLLVLKSFRGIPIVTASQFLITLNKI